MEDKNLALKCSRLIRLHFPALLLDSIGEALFEFELDVCSSLNSNNYREADTKGRHNSIEVSSRVFRVSARSNQLSRRF